MINKHYCGGVLLLLVRYAMLVALVLISLGGERVTSHQFDMTQLAVQDAMMGAGGSGIDVQGAGEQEASLNIKSDNVVQYGAARDVDVQHSCDSYICIEWLSAQEYALRNNAEVTAQQETNQVASLTDASQASANLQAIGGGFGQGAAEGGGIVGLGSYGMLSQEGGWLRGGNKAGMGYAAVNAGGALRGTNRQIDQQKSSGAKTEGKRCMQYQCFRGYSNVNQVQVGPQQFSSGVSRNQQSASTALSGLSNAIAFAQNRRMISSIPYFGAYVPYYLPGNTYAYSPALVVGYRDRTRGRQSIMF